MLPLHLQIHVSLQCTQYAHCDDVLTLHTIGGARSQQSMWALTARQSLGDTISISKEKPNEPVVVSVSYVDSKKDHGVRKGSSPTLVQNKKKTSFVLHLVRQKTSFPSFPAERGIFVKKGPQKQNNGPSFDSKKRAMSETNIDDTPSSKILQIFGREKREILLHSIWWALFRISIS